MGILGQTSNYQNFIKNNNIIPDYASEYKNEYLFIRGIDKKCGEFKSRLDKDIEGKIFDSPQAVSLIRCFNKFLKFQQLEYPNDISNLYLKEYDVRSIDTLEFHLEDYSDLYCDPNSFEFDQEKYDNNVENVYPGFKTFLNVYKRFKGKLKIKYFCEEDKYNLIIFDSDSDDEVDSDSDDGVDSDDINDILSDYEDTETDSD